MPGRRTNDMSLGFARRSGHTGNAAVIMETAKVLGKVVRTIANNKAQGGRAAPAPRRDLRPVSEPKYISAPVQNGYTASNLVRFHQTQAGTKSTMFKGCTVIGTVTTSATSSTSLPQVACYASSNPITFPDRMQIMASTFDKYVYKSARLKYQPQVSTATAGLVAVAIDRDYLDPPQVKTWAQSMSYEVVEAGNVWLPITCNILREKSERRTYFNNFGNDPSLRESEQFKFYVITTGVPASTTCGQLFLEYEIELISPVFAPDENGTNLSLFQMAASALSAVTVAALSGVFTITGLPQYADIGNALIEVMVSGSVATSVALAGVQIGQAGPQYVPGTVASVRYFMRALPAAGTYHVFTDFSGALSSNNGVFGGLYNSNAAAVSIFTAPRGIFRPVQAVGQ